MITILYKNNQQIHFILKIIIITDNILIKYLSPLKCLISVYQDISGNNDMILNS